MKHISNVAAVKGVLLVDSLEKSNKLCGFWYEHYKATVQVTRISGVVDDINIVIPAEYEATVKEIEEAAVDGNEVAIMCTGKVQTLKEWKTGKVLLFVLADFIGLLTGNNYEQENAVYIKAELGKQPIFRETPKGRHIADTTLKVDNELKPQGCCYIPTIFWGREALEISQREEGDAISVTGRLQSREYLKIKEDNTEELHTAYELSISSVDAAESEADDE